MAVFHTNAQSHGHACLALLSQFTCQVVLFFFLSLALAAQPTPVPTGSMLAEDSSASSSSLTLTPAERSWLAQHPVLKHGGEPNWPPIEFIKEGVYQGIASDYLELVEKKLGIKIELVPDLTWEESLQQARARKLDILPCAGPSHDREAYLIFSRPYLSFPLIIVTRNDAAFVGGMQDLITRTIAVPRDYYTHKILQRDFPKIRLNLVNDDQSALKAVSLGQADAFIGNLAVASYMIKKLGLTNLKIAAPTSYENSVLCFAVRNDYPELAAMIQKALNSITPQEQNEISNKWIAVRYEFGINKAKIWKISAWAALGILTILIVFTLWNRSLQRQIIQRRRAEEALRNANVNLENIFNAATPLCVISKALEVLQVNEVYCNLFGLTAAEVLGPIKSDLHPESPTAIEPRIGAILRGDLMAETEITARRADGKILDCYVLSRPYRDSQGNLVGIVENIIDVTELKRTIAALHDANAAKDRFFSIIGHDLKNPYQAQLGLASMLSAYIDNFNAEQIADIANKLKQSLKFSLALLDNLLTWARSQAGALEFNPVPLAVKPIIEENFALLHQSAQAKQIELVADLSDDLSVMGDANMLSTILRNLINNSIKFTTKEGRITVRGRDSNNRMLEITVIDTGVGISPDNVAKLFRLDTNVRTMGTNNEKGTGLGLHLCQEFVQRHGGQIWVTSDLGVGSEFHFTLPRAEDGHAFANLESNENKNW